MVVAGKSFKEVHLTIDFGTGTYPVEGWKFEQGTTKGIVSKVSPVSPPGNERDVVLRMNVKDQDLDPGQAIIFTTSSRAVEIFNVCFVQKGGTGAPVSSKGIALKQLMVEKEAISSIDFTGGRE